MVLPESSPSRNTGPRSHRRNWALTGSSTSLPSRRTASSALFVLVAATVIIISYLSSVREWDDVHGSRDVDKIISHEAPERSAPAHHSLDAPNKTSHEKPEGSAPEHHQLDIATQKCSCQTPTKWTAQAGQDRFVYTQIFSLPSISTNPSSSSLCCNGTFVEFGARNGIDHSNTYPFETFLGWKGLMFEMDDREFASLQSNRPNAKVIKGPVCPSYQKSVSFLVSEIPGWSGVETGGVYEPTRLGKKHHMVNATCYYLAEELRKMGMMHVDYMTIDTEGSEQLIIEDFPWEEFDIRVVQIEQLNVVKYPAQAGKKEAIIEHMTKNGYDLFHVTVVAQFDTDDLIFVKNGVN